MTSREENSLLNVNKVIYKTDEKQSLNSHHYLKEYNDWILHGQAAANAALNLKNKGFTPDIIIAHSWGNELFIKDVYPDTPFLSYFEWYTNPFNSDLDFNKEKSLSFDNLCELKIKNSPKLVSLNSCDHGITPTYWQLKQFPELFHNKISVIHDGVCCNFYKPDNKAKLIIPEINLDLSEAKEIITYATSGMEPYRGFPQFMEAVSIIQKHRPDCHIVIAGNDSSFYSALRSDGKTYKEYMIETLSLDLSRIHFTGFLSYKNYLKLLQSTHAHIYLTYPYILSWSLLEAMATGCLVIASNTEPVKEVMQDNENGLLVDFFSPEEIADKVDEVFSNTKKIKCIKENARKTILEKYSAQKLLAEHLDLINKLIKKEKITAKRQPEMY